jgi:hypothetical protein
MRYFEVYIKTDLTSGTILLEHEPEGLSEYGNKLLRHEIYHSVFVDINMDLRFVKEGRKMLKEAFDTYGINAKAEVEIKELNTATNGYERIFKGIADFTEYIEEELYVTVPLESSEKVSKFRSREGNKYNLANTESTDGVTIPAISGAKKRVRLPLHKMILWAKGIANWDKNINTVKLNTTTTLQVNNYKSGTWDENVIGDKVSLQAGEKLYTADKLKYISLNGILSWSITGTITEGTAYDSGVAYFDMKLQHLDNSGAVISTIQIYNYTDHAGTVNRTGSLDLSTLSIFGVNEGESLVFTGEWKFSNTNSEPHPPPPAGAGTHFDITIDTNTIGFKVIEEDTRLAGIASNCWLPFEAFSRLLQLITSETDLQKLLRSYAFGRTDSEPLQYASDGKFSKVAVTSGKAIMGKVLNVSFRDLFHSLSLISPIGLWYDKANDYFVIENIDHFYKQQKIATLGEVTDLTISVLKEDIHSKISGGYDNDSSYDMINGAIEFNTAYNYSTPVDKSKSTHELRVPFRADTIGILTPLYKQKQIEGTNDNSSDNVNFLLDCLDEQTSTYDYRIVTGADIYEAKGLENTDEWYNVRISPKRNLCRQGKLISGYLLNYQSGVIKYVRSKNDTNLVTRLTPTSPIFDEKADIPINTLDAPLFEPIQYEFEYKTPRADRNTIKANPHGYIEFKFKGKTYYGYIKEVNLNSSQNKGTFTLIKKH